MKGPWLAFSVRLAFGFSKDLQRLVLGRGGEGKVTGVRQQLARLHQAVDLILVALLLVHFTRYGEGLRNGHTGPPTLTGVRLIDDDREVVPALLVANLVQDQRELLDGRDDYLLTFFDELAQIDRTVRVPYRRFDL